MEETESSVIEAASYSTGASDAAGQDRAYVVHPQYERDKPSYHSAAPASSTGQGQLKLDSAFVSYSPSSRCLLPMPVSSNRGYIA